MPQTNEKVKLPDYSETKSPIHDNADKEPESLDYGDSKDSKDKKEPLSEYEDKKEQPVEWFEAEPALPRPTYSPIIASSSTRRRGMYIPTHYVVIFVLIFLGESGVIFLYTLIGLVKSNPLPYMMPAHGNQLLQPHQQQQQQQQILPFCQPYPQLPYAPPATVTVTQTPNQITPFIGFPDEGNPGPITTTIVFSDRSGALSTTTIVLGDTSSTPSPTASVSVVTTTAVKTVTSGVQQGQMAGLNTMDQTTSTTSDARSTVLSTHWITVSPSPSPSSKAKRGDAIDVAPLPTTRSVIRIYPRPELSTFSTVTRSAL